MMQAIITRFFPRSLKVAHRQWQQAKDKWDENKQLLSQKLTKARMAAQAAGVDTPQNVGVLRQAQQLLDAPPPRALLAVNTHLQNLFTVHGTSRWRSAPSGLWERLGKYEELLAAESYQLEEIAARLQLIVDIFQERADHPEYALGISPADILTYPEYAKTLLQLAKVQWEDRQVCLARLRQSFTHRLRLGQSWLQLLRENMSSYQHRLVKRGLDTLATQVPASEGQDLQTWAALHTKLDSHLLRLNKLAVSSLAESP